MKSHLAALREKAVRLPAVPGVYLMKDKTGRIIYVGKSRCLPNRVSSYFTGEHTAKTARMVASVADFDVILCEGEMEALSLENTLIKQHTPRYNIKLKDAKSYPYIRLGDEPYPRLTVTRERAADRARYFGPYPGISAAYAARDAVNRIFRLPLCRRRFPEDIGKDRPCLYAQMGRCMAPCTGNLSREEYDRAVRSAAAVLSGNIRDTVSRLEEDMYTAAAAERFEDAARLRDSVAALRRLTDRQVVVTDSGVDRDVFALYEDEIASVMSVLVIRDGKLCGKNEFVFPPTAQADSDALSAFLFEYYKSNEIPRTLLFDFPFEEEAAVMLGDALSEKAGRRVHLHTPVRGAQKKLCRMAYRNAEDRARRQREESLRKDRTLFRLAELLALEVIPERIEAYDISNIGSEHITAAMVVYADGRMQPSAYRTFRIESTEGIDDYGAMREALSRRLSHVGDGSPSLGEAPDLILLDGGVGHVGVGRDVLSERGLSIPIFGMVKDDFHKTRALTDGMGEIGIAGESDVYAMIYKIQEEVHRVAVRHTMNAKRKSLRRSKLEDIPGIGPGKAKKLLAAFGGLARIRRADEDDIAAVRGITAADAAAVFRYFHKSEEEGSKA